VNRNVFLIAWATILATLAGVPAAAQATGSAAATVSCSLVGPVSLTAVNPLNFGTLTLDPTQMNAGTVSVDALSDAISIPSGAIVATSGNTTAASFSLLLVGGAVTLTGSQNFTIRNTANANQTLSCTINTLYIPGLTTGSTDISGSITAGTGTSHYSLGSSQTLSTTVKIGGGVTVPPTAQLGNYTGTWTLTIANQ
jgi:hypothetical protein